MGQLQAGGAVRCCLPGAAVLAAGWDERGVEAARGCEGKACHGGRRAGRWALGAPPRRQTRPGLPQTPATTAAAALTSAPPGPMLGPLRPLPPRALPAPKQRGSGRGARRCPAGSGKQGVQQTSSPLRNARNFSLFFLSCCFLLSSGRGTRRVLCTPNRRATDGAVRKTFRVWKKSLMPREYHLKTAPKYSAAF